MLRFIESSYFYYSFYPVSLIRLHCVVTKVLFPFCSYLLSFFRSQKKSQMKQHLCTKSTEKSTIQLKPWLSLHLLCAQRACTWAASICWHILIPIDSHITRGTSAYAKTPFPFCSVVAHANTGNTASAGRLVLQRRDHPASASSGRRLARVCPTQVDLSLRNVKTQMNDLAQAVLGPP